MFLPKKLDIARLQDITNRIVNGEFVGRGEGATLAYLYLMLAEIDLGDSDNRYLYVGENEICTRYAAIDFVELLERTHPDHFTKQDAGWSPNMIVFNSQVFQFVSADQFANPDRMRGYRVNRVFVDVTGEKQHRLDKDGNFIMAMTRLETGGADFV